jgi:hypothetical protein
MRSIPYIVLAGFVSIWFTASAGAQTINCGLLMVGELPNIIIGEFAAEPKLSNFSDSGGALGVTATVSGGGKEAKFTGSVFYSKEGERIELAGLILINQVTKDQFQSEFGLFPQVTCSTP